MAAPKGNQFWLARSTHGRDKIFADADILWAAAVEYFEWCEANPLMESRVAQDSGVPTIIELPKLRAMTIGGLSLFLGIDQCTFWEYAKRDDFTKITKRIEEAIRDQKFAGASAGLLNANIIARDLGLADKVENDHSVRMVPVAPEDEQI